MEELLNKLYSFDYFGYYLLIAIVILLILFIIILFFGKKDQHKREVEATKKLQQINNDDNAFKEENNIVPLEIQPNIENNAENLKPEVSVESIKEVMEAPSIINSLDSVDNEIPEPVLPKDEEVSQEEFTSLKEVPAITEDGINESLQTTIGLENKEAGAFEQPQKVEPMFEETREPNFAFEDVNKPIEPLEKEENIINNTHAVEAVNEPLFNEVEVPEFNFEEIIKGVEETKETVEMPNSLEKPTIDLKEDEKTPVKNLNHGPQIFSSVYVPLENEEKSVPKKEELDIELPLLKKKEETVIKPELKGYDINALTGEEYNLKK